MNSDSKTTTKEINSIDRCTRCGTNKLIDITHHEFPKQRGLLFECMSCGNNSLRSNVSDDERQRRLAKIAADHLTMHSCQFCLQNFPSQNDYLTHLQTNHQNPMNKKQS